MINGNNYNIRLGIKTKVSKNGKLKPVSKFLKNSISSKRFKITPRQIKIKSTFITTFKKPVMMYLFITLFMV